METSFKPYMEAFNRPQKCPNMVLFGKFSQPYIQYPVRAPHPLKAIWGLQSKKTQTYVASGTCKFVICFFATNLHSFTLFNLLNELFLCLSFNCHISELQTYGGQFMIILWGPSTDFQGCEPAPDSFSTLHLSSLWNTGVEFLSLIRSWHLEAVLKFCFHFTILTLSISAI